MAEPSDTFVGRLHELTALHGSFDQGVAGRGRSGMLSGEPGIGKTRTARELAAHADQRGATVLWGYCHEEAGAPPYWPWVQIFRAYIDATSLDEIRLDMGHAAKDIAALVPELVDSSPQTHETPSAITDSS